MEEAELQEFFGQIKEKLNEIRALADSFGIGEDFVYLIVAGVYANDDKGAYSLKALTDFLIGDEDELDRLLCIGSEVYQDTLRLEQEIDTKLDKLLDDFGLTTQEDESE